MMRSMAALASVAMSIGLVGFVGGCRDDSAKPAPAAKNGEQPKPDKASGPPKKGVDPDDPSIVYDEPYEMVTKVKTYNGAAYDKAALCLDGIVKLVLPDTQTVVERHNQDGVVLVHMEKRMQWYSHGDESLSIKDVRKSMSCAVKRDAGSLWIGSCGEFSGLETANTMQLFVLVPTTAEVVRRAGLVGGRSHWGRSPDLVNPTRGEPRHPLTKKRDGQPGCWLPPTAEDGWHEIPTVADPERRAAVQE